MRPDHLLSTTADTALSSIAAYERRLGAPLAVEQADLFEHHTASEAPPAAERDLGQVFRFTAAIRASHGNLEAYLAENMLSNPANDNQEQSHD